MINMSKFIDSRLSTIISTRNLFKGSPEHFLMMLLIHKFPLKSLDL